MRKYIPVFVPVGLILFSILLSFAFTDETQYDPSGLYTFGASRILTAAALSTVCMVAITVWSLFTHDRILSWVYAGLTAVALIIGVGTLAATGTGWDKFTDWAQQRYSVNLTDLPKNDLGRLMVPEDAPGQTVVEHDGKMYATQMTPDGVRMVQPATTGELNLIAP